MVVPPVNDGPEAWCQMLLVFPSGKLSAIGYSPGWNGTQQSQLSMVPVYSLAVTSDQV
jgi:hypothetical protein